MSAGRYWANQADRAAEQRRTVGKMEEYISRESILKKAAEVPRCFSKMVSAWDIAHEPAAGVAEARHGTWKLKMVGAFDDLKQYSCSECGFSLPLNPAKIPPYCEDCGAKMSLEAGHETSESV